MKATIRGVPVQWRESGAGRPVLFVHGFPFHGGMWQAQLDGLPPDRRWIAPDLRGFGGSGAGDGPYSLDDLAGDLYALLDELELERTTLCGLSMGGYICFAFWRTYPERVRALALCDTRAGADGAEARAARLESAERARREGSAFLVEEMIPRLLAPETRRERPEVVRALREIMESASGEAVARAQEAMAARPDSMPLLRDIRVPVLLLAGAEDIITPPAELEAMDAVLQDSRLAIVPGAGHVPPVEQPAEFNRTLLEFVEEIDRAEA